MNRRAPPGNLRRDGNQPLDQGHAFGLDFAPQPALLGPLFPGLLRQARGTNRSCERPRDRLRPVAAAAPPATDAVRKRAPGASGRLLSIPAAKGCPRPPARRNRAGVHPADRHAQAPAEYRPRAHAPTWRKRPASRSPSAANAPLNSFNDKLEGGRQNARAPAPRRVRWSGWPRVSPLLRSRPESRPASAGLGQITRGHMNRQGQVAQGADELSRMFRLRGPADGVPRRADPTRAPPRKAAPPPASSLRLLPAQPLEPPGDDQVLPRSLAPKPAAACAGGSASAFSTNSSSPRRADGRPIAPRPIPARQVEAQDRTYRGDGPAPRVSSAGRSRGLSPPESVAVQCDETSGQIGLPNAGHPLHAPMAAARPPPAPTPAGRFQQLQLAIAANEDPLAPRWGFLPKLAAVRLASTGPAA